MIENSRKNEIKTRDFQNPWKKEEMFENKDFFHSLLNFELFLEQFSTECGKQFEYALVSYALW